MGKKIAVVLAGCGQRDGSEIHESVLAILALVRAGAEPVFFAPNTVQTRIVNHISGEAVAGERNMLIEAARIARGKIRDLTELKASEAAAVIFPGGAGASWNLSDFAEKGANCRVHPEAERVIREFHAAGKPLGFICIAPVLAAKVLGREGVVLTIGSDADTAAKLEIMGARHTVREVQDAYVDPVNRVVSTPAYMLGKNIFEVEAGISKLVQEVLKLSV